MSIAGLVTIWYIVVCMNVMKVKGSHALGKSGGDLRWILASTGTERNQAKREADHAKYMRWCEKCMRV